jgi:hypothetical protein
MAMRAMGGPTFYGERDDDARSVSSAGSYMDSVNPPLTARLPPAVRARSLAPHGSHRPVPSDRRLSQLEQQLHELEMEDWRTDRLISDAGPHDRAVSVWKPNLPPRRAADAANLRAETSSNQARTIQHESRIATIEAMLKVPSVGRNIPQSAHRTWHDVEERAMQSSNTSSALPHSRVSDLSRPESQSFGSPFSLVDTMLQSPASMPSRSLHNTVNGKWGAQTRFYELSAIRQHTHEISAGSRPRESGWQRDPKYASSPHNSSSVLARSPLNDNTRSAINFFDLKFALNPTKASLERTGAPRQSFQEHPSGASDAEVSPGQLSDNSAGRTLEGLSINGGHSELPLGHVPRENANGSSGVRCESNTDSKAELAQQVGMAVRGSNIMSFEPGDTLSDMQRGYAAA